jgi:hypothetical protein
MPPWSPSKIATPATASSYIGGLLACWSSGRSRCGPPAGDGVGSGVGLRDEAARRAAAPGLAAARRYYPVFG